MALNPCSLGWVGLRHAKAVQVPLVASYHTDIPGYAERYGLSLLRDPLWAYLRWMHNQADLNLCPSHFTRKKLEAHGFKRVRVWPHGVDQERFDPLHGNAEWRTRLSRGHPNDPLLLYVGRVALEKRIGWLRPVLDALPEAQLAIVGDGPARAELEALFAGTNTLFTGHLSGLDLSQAYASADVFCFPSANETFGNVVLEAMALGLPVVVPRSGGPVDHVIDGHNAFLVDPDNPLAFAAAVRQLAIDRSYARHLGRQARTYAETQSWDAVIDAMLEAVTELVRAYRLPSRGLCPRQRRQPRQIEPLWIDRTRAARHGAKGHSRRRNHRRISL
jgi:glycosyltransferase involved in cell wall biosynthesis